MHLNELTQQISDIVSVNNGYLDLKCHPLNSDTFYICCPYGIGDTLYVSALIKSYKNIHPEIAKICLIVKTNHAPIPNWFSAIDEVIISDEIINILNIFSQITQTWQLKNYLYGHFKKNELGALDPEYYNIKNPNMISRYKQLVMNVPEDSILENIKFSTTHSIDNIFNKKTVVLMPYAASTELLPMIFWEVLAIRLINSGYNVFTNVKDDSEHIIPGTNKLSEDLETTAQICESCLATISLRSGICDVLALTTSLLFVINTNKEFFDNWNIQTLSSRDGIANFLCLKLSDLDTILNQILYIFNIPN